MYNRCWNCNERSYTFTLTQLNALDAYKKAIKKVRDSHHTLPLDVALLHAKKLGLWTDGSNSQVTCSICGEQSFLLWLVKNP